MEPNQIPPATSVSAAPAKKSTWWIWLLVGCGCLALVAVVGILAALVIPNFVAAKGRAAQKRSMADLRTLAVAIEAYRTDHEHCPAARSSSELAKALVPDYLRELPQADGWGTPFRYQFWGDGADPSACDHYAIVSAGKDRRFEQEDSRAYEEGKLGPAEYDRDLVNRDGIFAQYP